MEVAISERCNQICDYCWVNKSTHTVLSLAMFKRAVDLFLDSPISKQTISFNCTEPLLHGDIYMKGVAYILRRSKKLGKDVTVVTTTNCLCLHGIVQRYIQGCLREYKNFQLNVSIDGNRLSHDRHRKLLCNRHDSVFTILSRNIEQMPREKIRAIMTIAPSEIMAVKENLGFILNSGFRKIDIFPQVFVLWQDASLQKIASQIRQVYASIGAARRQYYDIRLINRLWNLSYDSKLLCGSDARFYLFQWALLFPLSVRKLFCIGDVRTGIDLSRRRTLMMCLVQAISDATKGRCMACERQAICGFPLPLFLWCFYSRRNFPKYFKNYCAFA